MGKLLSSVVVIGVIVVLKLIVKNIIILWGFFNVIDIVFWGEDIGWILVFWFFVFINEL